MTRWLPYSTLDEIRLQSVVNSQRRSDERRPNVVSAYLWAISGDVATISVYGSPKIRIPALPAVYDGIRTVHVEMDNRGRPLIVLGPTTTAVVPEPEPEPEEPPTGGGSGDDDETDSTGAKRAQPKLVTRKTTIRPVWSGTYRHSFGTWGSWGYSVPGYPHTVQQGQLSNSGPLTGLWAYGSQIAGLKAESITAMRLFYPFVAQGQHTPTFRGSTNGGKPGGAPTLTGSSWDGTFLPWGTKVAEFGVPDGVRESMRTGSVRGVALVGTGFNQYGAARGKDHARGGLLAVTYTVRE